MANTDLQAIAVDWYLASYRLRASDLVEQAEWFAVFDPEFAVSHDGNQLIVCRPTSADLAAAAESLFSLRQVPHRAISTFADIPVTSVLALQAAGYDRTDFVLMAAAVNDLRRRQRGCQGQQNRPAVRSTGVAPMRQHESPSGTGECRT